MAEILYELEHLPKPFICALNGSAAGGGLEFALAADIRVAKDGPFRFGLPEVSVGILPGGGGTVRLSQLVGRSRALEVILGCDDVDADLAEQWGWVNRTLDPDDVWPFVDRLARRIASFPPHAVAAAKASVLRAEKDVVADLLAEGDAFNRTLGHPTTRAALAAFMERGGQTRAGELRLGELAGELGAQP